MSLTITIHTREDGTLAVATPWINHRGASYRCLDDCKGWLKRKGFAWDRAAKAWIGKGDADEVFRTMRCLGRPYIVPVLAEDAPEPAQGAEEAAQPAGEPRATERQVAYAAKLLRGLSDRDWHDADVPGPKPTEADLRTMTRAEVSAVIDSAKDMRGYR